MINKGSVLVAVQNGGSLRNPKVSRLLGNILSDHTSVYCNPLSNKDNQLDPCKATNMRSFMA